jgi:hypothetical protein
MNKDEQQKEAKKSLELGSAMHKDLSETLRQLKSKLVDYGKSLAVTNFNRDPNEISLVYYMDGAFDSSSVWWPVFVDFEVYDKNRKVEGMKTFYEYIQEAYGMGFVELLLNPETMNKTNRWDLAEIAMFNWLVSQAKLLNWNFIPSEKPIPVMEEEADETDEQCIAALIKKIHEKKEEYVLNELSIFEKPLHCNFLPLARGGSFLDDLQISICQSGETHSVIIFKDTLSEYLGRVMPHLVKDGLGVKALIAVETYHPVDFWVRDFIRRFKAEQGRELSKPEVLVPEHYRESGSDIEKVMLATHFNVFISELPLNLAAELKAEPSAKNALSKALWAAMAMKHLCRVGTKANNPVDLELGKVENYSHRARTGEWK